MEDIRTAPLLNVRLFSYFTSADSVIDVHESHFPLDGFGSLASFLHSFGESPLVRQNVVRDEVPNVIDLLVEV